ncbi:outer membrane-stress sensor serine endopeptidase DegS [Candidatus Williamhamiltonella defendens]|uniref:outer membrane-stress sensor serine endopeptidase DegS n=1 Tax=Candidatus Williamhamiltonella defendens TaxID=138072 RepID=UPI00130DB888|nr:outer membrane-stress sensor serine endopeptidase DegS [Candidatus Hamiltonella defensa]
MLEKFLSSAISGVIIGGILLIFTSKSPFSFFKEIPFLNFTNNQTPISYAQSVRTAAPAVVNVYNSNLNRAPELGSGVIISHKGYIITNKHVINHADKIIVALQNGQIYEASLVGSDSLTDLAVLKIDADNLHVIPMNQNRITHVGDVVLAIGNPYNLGQTITQGIISATGRVGLSGSGRQNFLQTDASINQGNSGGALVNTLGELVGINTLSVDTAKSYGQVPEGIGFAIPATLAIKVMHKLILHGRVIRGYIGIAGSDYPLFYEDKQNHFRGIKVNHVSPDGPAVLSGVQKGDIILSLNNKRSHSTIETMDQVAEIPPGSQIPIVVLRNGKNINLNITIIENPYN